MKNLKKLIAMMLMLASVLFFACDKDEDNDPLTADEAKTELSNLATEMSTVMDEMQNSEGIALFQLLETLPNPFTTGVKSNQETQVLKNIEKFLLPTTILSKEKEAMEAVPFDFNAHKGVYTYKNIYPYWDITLGGNVIEVNFPTTEANMLTGTNDGELTIYNYTETLITETYDWEIDEYYNPTAIDAEVLVNDVKLIDINMTASWVTSGVTAGDPINLLVDVFVIPFNFHIDFSHAGTAAEINAWIENDGAKIFAVGLDADFISTTMDDSPSKIYGYVQLLDVKFNATVKLKELEELFDAQGADIPLYTDIEEFEDAFNLLIDASVDVSGAKAADITFDFTTIPDQFSIMIDEEANIYLNIMFVYTDGTSESALPYFIVFVSELQEFFNSLDGFYGGF